MYLFELIDDDDNDTSTGLEKDEDFEGDECIGLYGPPVLLSQVAPITPARATLTENEGDIEYPF